VWQPGRRTPPPLLDDCSFALVPSAELPPFFLLPRRPLTSTLFPYTTLFRSHASRLPAARHRRHAGERERVDRPPAPRPLRGGRQDRKSTRLNSSHLGTSYAVFCLKKKIETFVGLGSNLGDQLGNLGAAIGPL